MIPNNKVHPAEEAISQKSLDLGPCIVITPRTLGFGEKDQHKHFSSPGYKTYLENDVDQEDPVQTQSPVHSEHKVNVNYSYTLHSPPEAVSKEIIKFSGASKKESSKDAFHPHERRILSFSSNTRPVVLPNFEDKDWRRKSVVSKDFSTGVA